LGAWVGVGCIWKIALLSALIGGIWALAQALWQRRTMLLLINTLQLLKAAPGNPGETSHRHAPPEEQTVPCAAAILTATAILFFTPMGALLPGSG
jgi:hypothetical protein